jgi:hypothetical protein
VSNGSEAERFVFYEGKTREAPAITVVPLLSRVSDPMSFKKKEVFETVLVNASRYPIFDVIAVYRDTAKGILWTGHIAELPARSASVRSPVGLRIPDFDHLEKEEAAMKADAFQRRTMTRLVEALSSGYQIDRAESMRDPSVSQGPTHSHHLFKKEAISLEKIWHDDFFESEGLTVIYRESPAYLDEAMPLNIYTSMFYYVKLARCGLVLNRNIPIEKIDEFDEALSYVRLDQWNERDPHEVAKNYAFLRTNRFLTEGMAKYHFGNVSRESRGWDPILARINYYMNLSDDEFAKEAKDGIDGKKVPMKENK